SRRGFMVAGALSLPFFFAATFAVPPSWGPAAGAVCVLLAFLATATAFSLFQVPYIALPAELTSDYDERTRLLGWRVVVLTAAILLFGAGGPELRSAASDPVLGYLLMGAVAGIAIGLGMWVASRTADAAAESPADHAPPPAGLRAQYAGGLRVLRRSQPFRALLGTYLLQALATGTMLAAAQYVATWVLDSEDAVTLVFIALVG
ncbi:MFS transporter, partial [Pseudomonas sp. BGM005]|nr:MFS transporter [Pseudomonas sp. BG5]